MYQPKYPFTDISKELGKPFVFKGIKGEAHMTPKEWAYIMNNVKHKDYLEIGSYHGYSTTAAIKGGAKSITCIDLNICPIPMQYATRIINEDSRQAWKYLNGKYDTILIDGNHTYEYCAADIHNYGIHLRDGGLMMIHDYGCQGDYLGKWGIAQAVDSINPENMIYITTVDSLIIFRKG